MSYPADMRAVLQFDEPVYSSIMARGKSVRYCVINVLIFGLLHAAFSLHFSAAFLQESGVLQPIPVASKLFFLAIGVAVSFFMHAGAALFLWVFSRGIGGRIEFLPVYFNLGVSFIGLWPLAPALASVQAHHTNPALYIFLGLAAAYGLAVIFFGTKSASGLSMIKMSGAMALTILFVACFLYLWI